LLEKKKQLRKEKEKKLEEEKKKIKLAEEKKVKDAADRKKKIEEKFNKIQKEHGGIHGTEDTGYDDDAMNAYMKGANMAADVEAV